MAVQESQTESHREGSPPSGSTRTRSTRQRKPQTPGEWMKAHKGLTAVAGVGAGVLLLAHKGGKGSTGGSGAADAAQAAAQEQQAVDNALANAAGTAIPQGSGDTGSSGSDPTNGGVPAMTLPLELPPGQIGPININTPPETPTSTPVTKGKKGKTTEGHHPTQKGKPGGKGKKAGGGKPAKGHQGGSGVTVHGKTFPGATGHHVGPPVKHQDGSTSHTVTVHHGGHTETHTSHNNGQSWTMNTPGHNPPSRGAAHHTSAPAVAPRPAPHPAPARPAPARPAPARPAPHPAPAPRRHR